MTDLFPFTSDFEIALGLFDEAEILIRSSGSRSPEEMSRNVTKGRGPQSLVARSAAMTIWYFKESMVLVEKAIRRGAASAEARVAWSLLEQANLYFDAAEDTRHAVGHTPDMYVKSKKLDPWADWPPQFGPKPQIRPMQSLMVLWARRMTLMWGKVQCSVDISETSLQKLVEVRDLFFQGIRLPPSRRRHELYLICQVDRMSDIAPIEETGLDNEGAGQFSAMV